MPELDESDSSVASSALLVGGPSKLDSPCAYDFVLPHKYELCDPEHIAALIADMVVETVQTNDLRRSRKMSLTKFQSL